MRVKQIVLVSLACLSLSGCGTASQSDRMVWGGAIGLGIGAAFGNVGGALAGAAIGAGIGAASGAM